MPRLSEVESLAVVCAWCGKQRHGKRWLPASVVLSAPVLRARPTSHGICPTCLAGTMPEVAERPPGTVA